MNSTGFVETAYLFFPLQARRMSQPLIFNSALPPEGVG
ncbi:hypothetical protein FHS54_000399 [Sphingobium vermicomposti]|uniref:Uncharacterized protein n=1 Tax=Sphingobium vermicomposti TaxID=529005 RepID=A0A846M3W7_9SPHN|nr:hypothetical protein [Sphingobium vermicomposti]